MLFRKTGVSYRISMLLCMSKWPKIVFYVSRIVDLIFLARLRLACAINMYQFTQPTSRPRLILQGHLRFFLLTFLILVNQNQQPPLMSSPHTHTLTIAADDDDDNDICPLPTRATAPAKPIFVPFRQGSASPDLSEVLKKKPLPPKNG